MTDEFLDKGIGSDRYLKAIQLSDEFEDTIEARLRTFGRRMVNTQSDLFEAAPEGEFNKRRDPRRALAFQRVHYPLRAEVVPPDETWKLNVHLYWLEPDQYDRYDVDGSLRAFGYKIKYADDSVDEEVEEQTHAGDWDVRTAENPFGDGNVAFYRHVTSTTELDAATDVLCEHFEAFGDEYAVADT